MAERLHVVSVATAVALLLLLNTRLLAQAPADSLPPTPEQESTLKVDPLVIQEYSDYGLSTIQPGLTDFRSDSLGQFGAALPNLGPLLQQAEGVYLRNYGGYGALQTLSLRGFATNQTNVTLNGVPYLEPLAGTVNFANFFLDGFTGFRVQRGWSGLATNTLGGQVDLQTRPSGQQQANVGGAAGSYGERQAQAGLQLNSSHYALNLHLNHLQSEENFPYNINEERGTRRNAGFRNQQYQAGYTHWFRRTAQQRTAIEVLGLGFLRNQNVAGPIVKGNPSPPREILQQYHHFHYARFRHSWRSSSDAFFQPERQSVSVTARHQTERLEHSFLGTTRDYRVHNFYAAANYTGSLEPLGELRLLAQSELRELYSENLVQGGTPTDYLREPWLNLGARFRSQGIRLKGPFNPSRLWFEAKGRLNAVQGFRPAANWGARLYGLYKKGQASRWKYGFSATVTHSQRHPSFSERFFWGLGNEALAPERAQNYALQIAPEYSLGSGSRVRVSLTPFFNQTRDKIISIPLSPVRWSTFAVGFTQTRGAEAALQFEYFLSQQAQPAKRPRITLRGGYTWLEARDFSITSGNQLPYTPQELISGQLQLGYRWVSFGLNAHYAGPRYHSLSNDALSFMEDYTQLDAYLGLRYSIGRFTLQGRLACANLADERYAVIQSYPMPGRRWRGTLRLFLRLGK